MFKKESLSCSVLNSQCFYDYMHSPYTRTFNPNITHGLKKGQWHTSTNYTVIDNGCLLREKEFIFCFLDHLFSGVVIPERLLMSQKMVPQLYLYNQHSVYSIIFKTEHIKLGVKSLQWGKKIREKEQDSLVYSNQFV